MSAPGSCTVEEPCEARPASAVAADRARELADLLERIDPKLEEDRPRVQRRQEIAARR